MKHEFKQSKNWCFTDYALRDWKSFYEKHDWVRYIAYGEEICPDTKRVHYQGWIQLNTKKTMKGFLKFTGPMHVEACKGNEYHQEDYCSKDGIFHTYGEFIKQGDRLDIYAYVDKMKKGEHIMEIALDEPELYCRYRNGLRDIYNYINQKERKNFNKETEVTYIYGETDKGKTRYVKDNYPDSFKIEGSQLKWFDGYDGQDVLHIDEYDNDVPITRLLNLTDRYDLRLETKGGFVYRNWTKVFIT